MSSIIPYAAPPINFVTVQVGKKPSGEPDLMMVPANSEEEALRLLRDVGNGVPAGVAWGSTLEPIRQAYKRQLEQVELAIRERRARLGPNPSAYELRGLAQWAARQRTLTARLWRIPLPATGLGLEVRDWRMYGAGGRTFDNLVARNARQGLTGRAAYENILGSAKRSNVKVNAEVARGAAFLRRGGGVLAVAGLGISAYDIWKAPAERRGDVAKRHSVGLAGGLVGAEVAGGLLAIGAGLLFATPPGWLVIAVGLVGSVGGAMIADRTFYPSDYQPVSQHMRAGMAVDPRYPVTGAVMPGRLGGTTLPVVDRIAITPRGGETPAALSHRAFMQAAASVGASLEQQKLFADRNGGGNLEWVSGDPSPTDGGTMSGRDISRMVGQDIVFRMAPAHMAQLLRMIAR